MTAFDRISELLFHARVAGGWIDEDVAAAVLKELGLDVNGDPIKREAHTSSEIGHG